MKIVENSVTSTRLTILKTNKKLASFEAKKEKKIIFTPLGSVPLLLKVHPEEEFHFHQRQQKTHPDYSFW